jgi:hypothetical protein
VTGLLSSCKDDLAEKCIYFLNCVAGEKILYIHYLTSPTMFPEYPVTEALAE